MMRRRPCRPRHAQLHLPSLSGHEALLLAAICERIISAVWRAHHAAMIDVMANDLPASPFRAAFDTPPDVVAPSDDGDPF